MFRNPKFTLDGKYLENPAHCPYPKERKLLEDLDVSSLAHSGLRDPTDWLNHPQTAWKGLLGMSSIYLQSMAALQGEPRAPEHKGAAGEAAQVRPLCFLCPSTSAACQESRAALSTSAGIRGPQV